MKMFEQIKKMKFQFLPIVGMMLLMSCEDKEEGMMQNPPAFQASIPENGQTNVAVGTKIRISFSEPISLEEAHGITLNGNGADAEEITTNQIVLNDILEGSTEYTVVVPAGAVKNEAGVALAEAFTLTFTTEETLIVEITETLVTENPLPQAVNVYNFLKENYGENIVSATHGTPAWNLNEAEWVNRHTGKYPAMATFDYIFLRYSPANWVDYSDIGFIQDWWDNNGLVAANWHWNVPPSESENDVEQLVYQNETSFKPSNVVIEGTWENTYAKEDLDELAEYFQILQDNNIPVIWRPLHEAAGNIYEFSGGRAWFWWGSEGGEAYTALWRFVYDHLKAKGINNLIWVWTTQTNDDSFYPGDEYVDIIGRDIYNNTDAADLVAQFEQIQATYPTKMIAMSEFGNTENISKQWADGARWSYFMPWYDYARTDNVNTTDFGYTSHEHANVGWWLDAVGQDYVITRDMMPSLK